MSDVIGMVSCVVTIGALIGAVYFGAGALYYDFKLRQLRKRCGDDE